MGFLFVLSDSPLCRTFKDCKKVMREICNGWISLLFALFAVQLTSFQLFHCAFTAPNRPLPKNTFITHENGWRRKKFKWNEKKAINFDNGYHQRNRTWRNTTFSIQILRMALRTFNGTHTPSRKKSTPKQQRLSKTNAKIN